MPRRADTESYYRLWYSHADGTIAQVDFDLRTDNRAWNWNRIRLVDGRRASIRIPPAPRVCACMRLVDLARMEARQRS